MRDVKGDVRDVKRNCLKDERALSTLVEYILLISILLIFFATIAINIDSVLKESQAKATISNRFSDVASQVSTIYTDYVLLKPENGWIKSRLALSPKIADEQYEIALQDINGYAFVKVYNKRYEAYSGLGYTKHVFGKGEIGDIVSGGISQSGAANPFSPSKPVIAYKKEKRCTSIPKPRIELKPGSVDLNKQDNVSIRVYIENENEISGNITWILKLWNGSVIEGSGDRTINVKLSWYPEGCEVNGYNATCIVEVKAFVEEKCNSSFKTLLLVTNKPSTAPPYLIYEKWVEPEVVAIGEEFNLNIRIEGRGFTEKGVNLTTVHLLDNSGSMIYPALLEELSEVVKPNVVRMNVTVPKGDVLIKAYTTKSLPGWYSNEFCKACNRYKGECPWYGENYDDGFVKLYVNGTSYSENLNENGKFGVKFEESIAKSKKYSIEVVARAPESIDLHIEVYSNNTLISSKSVADYTNYRDVEVRLIPGVSYTFLMLDDVSGIPRWTKVKYGDEQYAEDYYVSCGHRYWEYKNGNCGKESFEDGKFNIWVIEPDGNKDFIYRSWHKVKNNYQYDYIKVDYFKPSPQPGVYRLRIVPTGKDVESFAAKVYLERIDAAKMSIISYNSLLGNEDYAGLAKFSTSAERIAVSTSPLKYLTNDFDRVNSELENIKPSCATDPAEGLYRAAYVFPIWNESGNNCSSCIANTRPLVILLSDGEPTSCDSSYFDCSCNDGCNGYYYCDAAEEQARCVAQKLKQTYIGDYNITLCTIAFSESVGGRGREFMKDIASPRPDTGEKCYFFARGLEDLVKAYKSIYSAFNIVAKNIVVYEVVNTTLIPDIDFVGYKAFSSIDGDISDRVVVKNTAEGTKVILNLTSLKEDEVVDLIIRLRGRAEGIFNVNHPSSYIEYDALDYTGEYKNRVRIPIESERSKVRVIGEENAVINLS